ncbi:peptidase S51 [Aquipuribacter nitratireducens]|uniref:Peptidase S51 n=1 Tax=Aquipuribacter nitratireducens TaxID=650104 RepID=A0ABW0GKM6_9MICO
MLVQLIGGGWDDAARPGVYGPLLDVAGSGARVACVVLDEGDGHEQFRRWERVLLDTARCEPVPVLVPPGGLLDVADLGDADALLVCGGLTPAYADALVPAAGELRAWLAARDRPYAGFSAGTAVAGEHALVGGWRVDGVPVCPEDAGEDLDEVGVVAGLGLVPGSFDVHASTWGTLGRAVAAVASGRARSCVAVDEGTAVQVVDGDARVVGTGAAWVVARAAGGSVAVTRVTAGGSVPLGA